MPLPIAALAAAIGLLISPILRGQADYAAYWQNGYFECDFTLSNLLIGFLCTGYFPIFPWIAFSLCGYVAAAKLFGPIDAEESLVSPWTLVWLGAALIALSLLAIRFRIYLPDPIGNNYLGGWTMFPPTIEYVVGTLGMSLAMLGLSHRWIDRNPEALRWKGCSISRGRSAVIRYPFISCILSFTCGPFGSTVFPVASSRPIFG